MKNSRLLSLLPSREFTTNPEAMTVAEIARAKNLSRSHAQKLLLDLVSTGQVRKVFKKVNNYPVTAYLMVERKGK